MFSFNCLLNDSSDDDGLIPAGKLFQAVRPAVRNAQSPNLVLVDRVDKILPVFETADRSAAVLGLL